MSKATVPVWTWRDAVRKMPAPPLTKLVCYAIGNYLSDVGQGCWPEVATLERDTGLSKRAILKHIKTAEALGLLDVERRRGRDGRQLGNMYFPRFPDEAVLARPGKNRVHEDHPARPSARNAPGSEHRVHEMHPARPSAPDAPGPGARDDMNRVHEVHPNSPRDKYPISPPTPPVDQPGGDESAAAGPGEGNDLDFVSAESSLAVGPEPGLIEVAKCDWVSMAAREAEPERVARYIDRVASVLPMPRDRERLAKLGNAVNAIATSLRGYDLDVIDRAAEATITGNAIFPSPKQAVAYLNAAVMALAEEREARARNAKLEAMLEATRQADAELVEVRRSDLRMINRAIAWARHEGDATRLAALQDRTSISAIVPRGWLRRTPPESVEASAGTREGRA